MGAFLPYAHEGGGGGGGGGGGVGPILPFAHARPPPPPPLLSLKYMLSYLHAWNRTAHFRELLD